MILVINITKKFKKFTALNDINLSFEQGNIYGLIGKNGAGKTTLLKIIAGLIKPSQGDVTFDAPTDIGLLIESPGIFHNMSAYENIRLKALACGIKQSKEEIYSLLKFVGLGGAEKKRSGKFSLGMKQRLGLALALIGNPKLLILDEPTNGLDPGGILEFRNLLLNLNQKYGTTMIISSHILDELSKVATHYVIMNDGKILVNSTKEEFQSLSNGLPLDEFYVQLIGGDNAFGNQI